MELRSLIQRCGAVFLLLLVLQAFAYGLSIRDYGFYADDWVFAEHTSLASDTDFACAARSFFFDATDPRPLRCIEHGLIAFLIRSFGFPSAYLLQLALETLSVFLLYLLLARSFTPPTALLTSVLFLLAPLDTTQLWLATFHWRIAFLLACAALLLLDTRIWPAAPLLILISASFNEGFLAWLGIAVALPLHRISTRTRIVRLIVSFSIIASGYFLWRFVLFPAISPDPRMVRLMDWDASSDLLRRFALNYIVALYVILVASIRFCLDAILRHPLIFIAWLTALVPILTAFLRVRGPAPAARDTRPCSCSDIPVLLRLGAAAWIFTYWTGIFDWTGFAPGGGTRLNYPGNLSFAAWTAAVILPVSGLGRASDRIALRNLRIALTISIALAALLTRTHLVRMDYVEAWRDQKTLIPALTDAARDLEPGTVIILKYDDPPGRSISTFTDTWHHDAIVRLFFPGNVRLVLEKNIWKYEFPREGDICITNIFEAIRVTPDRLAYWIWDPGELHRIKGGMDRENAGGRNANEQASE